MSAESGNKGYTAEEYQEKRLIQVILDDAERVKEQKRRARDFLRNGVIDELTAQRMYRSEIEDFIIDSKYKIQETEQTVEVITSDDEKQEMSCWDYFWHTTNLGKLKIPGQDDPYQFRGLKSIREFEDPLAVAVETEQTDLVRGRVSETQWREYQIPWSVLKKAYEELLDFWGMHGLHITTDDGVPTWSFNEVPDEPEEEAARL